MSWDLAVGNLQRVRSDYPPLHLFSDGPDDDERKYFASARYLRRTREQKMADRDAIVMAFIAANPDCPAGKIYQHTPLTMNGVYEAGIRLRHAGKIYTVRVGAQNYWRITQ